MAITTQTVRVDLNTGRGVPTVYAHQNDSNRAFVFEVYNNGVSYTLSGATVKFAYQSPIKKGKYSVISGSNMASGTVSGNKVTFNVPASYLKVSGKALLTMIITNSSNNIRPVNIIMVVKGSADGDEIVAEASDFPDYVEEKTQTIVDAYLEGLELVKTVTSMSAMTDTSQIYRYNGTEAGQNKGLYYYSQITSTWVLIGSQIQQVSSASQMTDTRAIYYYTGSEQGYVKNSLHAYNGTTWLPVGSGVLVASSASQMTNTGAIYKYTGSESGYEPNGLYYHNGTEWKLIINNDLFTAFKNEVIENLDSIDYYQLAFGESTGINKIYFTGNVPTTATTYGVIGRIIECKAGETIYMSGALSTANITNVKILSAIPSGQYGAIPSASIIGTLEQTEDNVYTIPSSLTNCVGAFLPGKFVGMSVAEYEALDNGVIEENSIVNGYVAGGNQRAKIVSKLPFTTVPQTTVRYQEESFWISEKKNKAFYASLFKAVSPLVNSNIALLGDSLSEQSAVVDASYGWLGRICFNYCATGKSWAVGQQRWYNTSSLTKGAVWQVKQLLASDFIPDYVIFEFGTNDVWSGSSKFGSYEDTASDTTEKSSCAMRWCIETIQENYPNARILCIMPMLRNNNGLKPTAQDTYITLADQILDDYSIHRIYPYKDSGIVFDMMRDDGVHLAKMNGNYYDNENSVAVKKYSYIVERGLLELH